jgi:hypothetical protein
MQISRVALLFQESANIVAAGSRHFQANKKGTEVPFL